VSRGRSPTTSTVSSAFRIDGATLPGCTVTQSMPRDGTATGSAAGGRAAGST
jgi:hypothetical protein